VTIIFDEGFVGYGYCLLLLLYMRFGDGDCETLDCRTVRRLCLNPEAIVCVRGIRDDALVNLAEANILFRF